MFLIIITTIFAGQGSHVILPQRYATMDECSKAAVAMARAHIPKTNEMKSWGCLEMDREARR